MSCADVALRFLGSTYVQAQNGETAVRRFASPSCDTDRPALLIRITSSARCGSRVAVPGPAAAATRTRGRLGGGSVLTWPV